MLGFREANLYGNTTYSKLKKDLFSYAREKKICLKIYQSNSESAIINYIQKHYNKFDGFVVNLGAYTHYSYAIRDAFELVKVPIIEVHISNISEREEFRKISVIADLSLKSIIGHGTDGYFEAIDLLQKGA